MTILAADDVTRANQAGWGTSTGANGGQVWSLPVGSGWTITSNSGRANNTGNSYMLLGSGTQADTEGYAQSILQNFGSSPIYAVVLRAASDASTYYRFDLAPGGSLVRFTKAGVGTLASTAASFTSGHVYAARFRATGGSSTLLQGRFWDTSGGEPGTWDLTYTDSSSPNLSGQYGVYLSDGISGDIQITSVSFNNTLSSVVHLRLSDGYGGAFS